MLATMKDVTSLVALVCIRVMLSSVGTVKGKSFTAEDYFFTCYTGRFAVLL